MPSPYDVYNTQQSPYAPRTPSAPTVATGANPPVAPTGQMGQPRAQGATPGAAMDPLSPGGQSRNDDIYNVRNPQMAVRAALRALGYDASSANPVFRTILNMAPGLASSFLIRGAHGGENTEQVSAQGGLSRKFGDFLQSALAGGNNMSAMNMLRDPLQGEKVDGRGGAYGSLMSLERDLTNHRRSIEGEGGNAHPGTINPYAAYLDDLLQTDPNAAPGLAASLYSPFLGAASRPYVEGVQSLYERGRDEMSRDPNRPEVNPFSWLLNPSIRY